MRSWEGRERKRMRDRARMRALIAVSSYHRDEHRAAYQAEVGGSQQARWNRAMVTIARRYPGQFSVVRDAELAVLGYKPHPCNPEPTPVQSATELSGPGAALTARDLPEPGERSEMAQDMR